MIKYTNIDIYQAYINEVQMKDLSPLTIPYDASKNLNNSAREYEIFLDINYKRQFNTIPWGMFSSKFESKTNISLHDFKNYALSKFNIGYELVFINPMIGNESIFKNVWEQGEISHKGMDKISNFIENQLNISNKKIDGKNYFAFCNYFIATPFIWAKYFNFCERILNSLNEQEMYNSDVWMAWMSLGHYKRAPNTTMRPFVIERLFSIFLKTLNENTYCWYEYKRDCYEKKFGTRIGSHLYNLSLLKNISIKLNKPNLIKLWNIERSKLFNSEIMSLINQLDDPSPVLTNSHINNFNKFTSKLKTLG